MKTRNNIQEVLVIASFPKHGSTHGPATVGVASYTKNMLVGLLDSAHKDGTKLDITVLADRLANHPTQNYIDSGLRVKRVWKRNNIWLYIHLLKEIITHPAPTVVVAFELAMLGGPLVTGFLPLFLLTMRLLGKQSILVCHHTILNLADLSGHIGVRPRSLKLTLLNAALACFYRMTCTLSTKIIVFEEHFRQLLSRYTHAEKFIVIPHGVEKAYATITKQRARCQLHIKREYVVLAFGFIGWYKGTDWIARVAQNLKRVGNRNVRIIIAGGPNPNHIDKPYYQTYVARVNRLVRQSGGRVTVTGFVPETRIAEYFAASDVVLFPYRTVMSASGPLAMALRWGKPFLLSRAMESLTKTDDFAYALSQSGIMEKDMFFPLSSRGLARCVRQLIYRPNLHRRFANASRMIRESRNFVSVGMQYRTVLLGLIRSDVSEVRAHYSDTKTYDKHTLALPSYR